VLNHTDEADVTRDGVITDELVSKLCGALLVIELVRGGVVLVGEDNITFSKKLDITIGNRLLVEAYEVLPHSFILDDVAPMLGRLARNHYRSSVDALTTSANVRWKMVNQFRGAVSNDTLWEYREEALADLLDTTAEGRKVLSGLVNDDVVHGPTHIADSVWFGSAEYDHLDSIESVRNVVGDWLE
jgi:hypothetical protein